jgi:hypothetical protein
MAVVAIAVTSTHNGRLGIVSTMWSLSKVEAAFLIIRLSVFYFKSLPFHKPVDRSPWTGILGHDTPESAHETKHPLFALVVTTGTELFAMR